MPVKKYILSAAQGRENPGSRKAFVGTHHPEFRRTLPLNPPAFGKNALIYAAECLSRLSACPAYPFQDRLLTHFVKDRTAHSLLTLCQFRGQHDPAGKQPDDLLIQLIHFLPHLKRISCRLLLFRHLRRRPQQRKIVEKGGVERGHRLRSLNFHRTKSRGHRRRRNTFRVTLQNSSGQDRTDDYKAFLRPPDLCAQLFQKRFRSFSPCPLFGISGKGQNAFPLGLTGKHSAQGQEFYIFLERIPSRLQGLLAHPAHIPLPIHSGAKRRKIPENAFFLLQGIRRQPLDRHPLRGKCAGAKKRGYQPITALDCTFKGRRKSAPSRKKDPSASDHRANAEDFKSSEDRQRRCLLFKNQNALRRKKAEGNRCFFKTSVGYIPGKVFSGNQFA